MSGVTNLETLIKSMKPVLDLRRFVFVSRAQARYGDGLELSPIAAFEETEGLTLIVPKEHADLANENYEGIFRMISLAVHSSLEAVGLTAAVSQKLTEHGISANVVAAFYHDHVFVPESKAQDALDALKNLSEGN